TGTMPHAEVGVQNDPIHAIVAAAQEILIQSVQPICHGGYARRTPAYFKLPRRGHFFAARSEKKRSLFVDDVERAEAFYTERVGFVLSEETTYRGARCVFLRCGAEHHSLGLFPKELRRGLGLSERTTCMSFGVEVGSYAQLREAVAFLKSHGVTFVDAILPELYPGIDYSV